MGITLVVIVIIAVVVVVGVVGLTTHQRRGILVRRLRSTSFSRRRSDRIKRAAARDVAMLQRADREYVRRRPGRPRRADPDDEL